MCTSECCNLLSDTTCCSECSYSFKDKGVSCIPFSSVTSCEDCPFGYNMEHSDCCVKSKSDYSHPCESDEYRELPVCEVIDLVTTKIEAYESHLLMLEEEQEREDKIKKSKQGMAKRVRLGNYSINSRITEAKKLIRKLRTNDARFTSMASAFDITNRIMSGESLADRPKVRSPFADKLEETENLLESLLVERKENTKVVRKRLLEEDKGKATRLAKDYASGVLPKPLAISLLKYNGTAIGLSVEFNMYDFLALSILDRVNVPKSNMSSAYYVVDITFDNCKEYLVSLVSSRHLATRSLIEVGDELVSDYERRFRVKDLELTHVTTKNLVLRSVIKKFNF